MTLIIATLVGLTILLGIFGILNIIKFSFKAMTWTLAIFGQCIVDLARGLFWVARLAFRLLRGIAHVAIYGLITKRPTTPEQGAIYHMQAIRNAQYDAAAEKLGAVYPDLI